MRRREFLKYSAATALAGSVGYRAARADLPTVKVVVIGAKTGPLAPGAAVTHFPPYQLWAHEVNERGGLKLKEGQRKIELIEYDDRTQPPEAIKAVERAATVDKADWIGGPYATGFNLATAPTFAKYNYPQLTQACVTDQGPALVKKYPGFFMFQSSTSAYAKGAIGVLKKLKDSGQIGNKVAVVNVGDDFGIELANAGRPLFKQAGFEIVYDKSYPLGTQDYTPVIKAAKAANPDAFVAWSYPPDTFGLADAAKIEALSVKAYYCAVGCAFQGFSQKNGAAAENILGAGGVTTRPTSAISTSATRPSPTSTPTTGAARSTTRCSRCSRNRSRRSARWTATPSRPTSGTASSRPSSARPRCPARSSTRSGRSASGRAAFFSAVAGEGFPNYAQVKLKASWG